MLLAVITLKIKQLFSLKRPCPCLPAFSTGMLEKIHLKHIYNHSILNPSFTAWQPPKRGVGWCSGQPVPCGEVH